MPASVKERTRDMRTGFRRMLNLEPIPATIITRNGSIFDPAWSNRYWVSYQTSNGLSTVRSVGGPAVSMPIRAGTPVILEYWRGRLRIREIDTDRLLSAGGDPITELQKPYSDSTPQGNIETLRLVPKSGLTVSLRGWNPIIANVYHEFIFADIDLSSFVPTTGQMRYVLIAVLHDLSGVETVGSTARDQTDGSLGQDDINEALALLTAGNTGMWAVKLIGGQTSVSQQDIDNDAKDLRGIINIVDATITALQAQVDALTALISRLLTPIADVLQAQIFDFDPLMTSDPLVIQVFS